MYASDPQRRAARLIRGYTPQGVEEGDSRLKFNIAPEKDHY